jgi:Tfp pilus assembly protein PilO
VPATASPTRSWRIDAAGVGACLAITILGVLVVVQPAVRVRMDQASLREELLTLREQVAELEGARTRMKEELGRLDDRLAANRLQLQGPEHLNTRMARIIESAASSGIVIDETRSGQAGRAELYQAVPVELSGTGSYPGCTAFLHGLHDQLPDTGVVSFELTGNPGRAAERGRFRFNLVWYAALAAADDR